MQHTFKVGDKVKFCEKYSGVSGLTTNKIYEVLSTDHDSIDIESDNGEIWNYMHYRFKLVEDTLFEDIQKAKEFIGKKIQDDDGYPSDGYIPTTIGVGNIFCENSRVRDYLQDSGKELVVYVESDHNLSLLHEVVLFPEEVVIKLTDDYDAKINKNNVVVGCQTIPIEKVREILTAWEKL